MFKKANTKPLCRQLGLRDELSLMDQAWNSEAGALGAMAKITALDNGALIVEVTSSPAMHELTLRRRELLRRINRHFQNPFLRDIDVRLAR